MKAKRLAALILAGAMAVSTTACGSSESASSASSAGAVNSSAESSALEKANLVWAGWSGEEDSTKAIVKEMIDSYNAKGGSQVGWVGWPWADTQQQLVIRNQGSEALDIAQVDIGMFGALSEMGILADMNDVMGKDYLAENYDPAALKVGQVDGKQLAMPWSIASISMVYNPTLLSKVGYTEPPKTVAEFEECLKKLKEYDKDIIPYGVATKEATMATDFQPWLWTFGGSLLDDSGKVTIKSDAAAKAMDWYKSLKDKDYIQMNITRADARQLFAKGKIAFYDDAIASRGVAKSNGIADADLDNSIKPMKRPVLKEGDTPQSAMWGHLLVVFKKSAHQQQAADFIKHVVSEEQSLKYLKSNDMLPVLKTALVSEDVKKNDWDNTWVGITQNGRTLEFAKKSNGTELNNIIVEELQGVLLGQKTSAAAVDSLDQRLNSSLD
ncbi:ABC transporter substrate-binding protein [Caproiciproducens sp.]